MKGKGRSKMPAKVRVARELMGPLGDDLASAAACAAAARSPEVSGSVLRHIDEVKAEKDVAADAAWEEAQAKLHDELASVEEGNTRDTITIDRLMKNYVGVSFHDCVHQESMVSYAQVAPSPVTLIHPPFPFKWTEVVDIAVDPLNRLEIQDDRIVERPVAPVLTSPLVREMGKAKGMYHNLRVTLRHHNVRVQP